MWWEGSLSLTCYPLQEPSGKSAMVHPSRHMPQASTILCSSLSEDSLLLALGLQSGTVVLWNDKMSESVLQKRQDGSFTSHNFWTMGNMMAFLGQKPRAPAHFMN